LRRTKSPAAPAASANMPSLMKAQSMKVQAEHQDLLLQRAARGIDELRQERGKKIAVFGMKGD